MLLSGHFVFPTHDEEWGHNRSKLLDLYKTFLVPKIASVSKGPYSKTGKSENAGGLDTVYICKKMLGYDSVNLCVKFDLYNGAIGIVKDIIYCNDKRPPSLPDVVMVEVPNYSGPPFIPEKPKVVPIFLVEREKNCRCHFCRRKQIPLRLGWATTIHRCQGMTIGEGEVNRYIVIHPGTKAFESRNPGALCLAIFSSQIHRKK